MKTYKKMGWEGLANYVIDNLKEGSTIEFATDYTEWEGYHCWYFIRIVCIPEYQSRFIIIDYCGGEEAYAIPLNNYSHGFDGDDKNYIREYIKDYFTWCNNLGFEDSPIWVEEEIQTKRDWTLTDNDCHQHICSDGDKYELIQFVWLDTTSQDKANGLHEYCVVHAEIEDMDNLYPEEIEWYLSAYGYTQKELEAKYGIDGARDLIAECVLETDCLNDSCVIAEFDTKKECIDFINKYVKEH